MNIGMKIIISTVKMRVIPTPRVSSSFLARVAAATAMAADTPQTDVAAAMIITSGLLTIFRTLVPKSHMKMITVGVTNQATISPGMPMLRILPNRISAPSSTRPVLMYISVLAPGLSHSGVPIVLEMSRPNVSRPSRVAQSVGLGDVVSGEGEGDDGQDEDGHKRHSVPADFLPHAQTPMEVSSMMPIRVTRRGRTISFDRSAVTVTLPFPITIFADGNVCDTYARAPMPAGSGLSLVNSSCALSAGQESPE